MSSAISGACAVFQSLEKDVKKVPGPGKTSRIFSRPWKILAAVVLFAPCAARGLDLHILRHAETMANVTGIHTEEMANQFSPKGLEHVGRVTTNLAVLAPDVIVCSPLWRTRQTILPFLRDAGRTAEIWPELEECCWQSDQQAPLTDPRPPGPAIALDGDETGRFTFREGVTNRFGAVTYADGVAQVRRAVELLRERFGGRDVNVVVVTHFHAGSRILELLLGEEPRARYQVPNAKLIHVQEQADGSFRLLTPLARLPGG